MGVPTGCVAFARYSPNMILRMVAGIWKKISTATVKTR